MKLKLSAVLLALTIAGTQADYNGPASIKRPFNAASKAETSSTTPPQILYHGGPVMTGPNSVYVIYYGTGFAQTTQPIINDFLEALANYTPEYAVNHGYYQLPGPVYVPPSYRFRSPSPSVTSGASDFVFFDAGSQGNQLNSNSITAIIANAMNNGLARDQNGVYLVVTSPDIKVSGFCGSYCAYHNKANLTIANGSTIHVRYALIPDPSQRCNACNGGIAVYGDSVTPNGDIGADTMTDDIMHELSETVTDPDISAWYTQNGAEIADLCNFYYGPLQTGPSWSLGTVGTGTNAAGRTFHYNASLTSPGGTTRLYLIQQIWKNTTPGACAAQ